MVPLEGSLEAGTLLFAPPIPTATTPADLLRDPTISVEAAC